MVEIQSTSIPHLQADNKQTNSNQNEKPKQCFSMPNAAMPLALATAPHLRGENSLGTWRTGSLGSIRKQQLPGETTATEEDESPPRGALGTGDQLQRVKAGEKSMEDKMRGLYLTFKLRGSL